MTKKSSVMYMSFLPIIILVALILGAGYFLLKGDIKIPFLSSNNRIEVRRLNGYPTVVETTEVVDKQRLVIKSEDELKAFFNSIDKTGALALSENVDFNKEYVIAASTKTFVEGGHSLKIKRIYDDREDGALLVSLEQIDPSEDCIADTMARQSTQSGGPEAPVSNVVVDMVSVKKTDKTIDFELKRKDAEECELE